MLRLHVQGDAMRRGRHELTHGSAEQHQPRERDDGDESKEQPEFNQALRAPMSGEDHLRYLPVLVQRTNSRKGPGPFGKLVLSGHRRWGIPGVAH